MPYEIRGLCVHKVGDDKPLKCYKTAADARKYLAALEANVPDAKKDFATDGQRKAFFALFGDIGSDPSWSGGGSREAAVHGKYFDYGTGNNSGDNHVEAIESDAAKAIPKSTVQSVVAYTADGYTGINADLRSGKSATSKVVKDIDKAIDSHELPENTALYRGMTMSPEAQGNLKPGATFTDNGYVSTSLSQKTASSFGGAADKTVIFRVKAPKGAKGLPVAKLSGNEHAEEHEIILPRGSKFVIQKVTKGADGKTYVDAKLYKSKSPAAAKKATSPNKQPNKATGREDKFVWDESDIEFGEPLFEGKLEGMLANLTRKEGRVLAGRNLSRAREALKFLMELIMDAGVNIDELMPQEKAASKSDPEMWAVVPDKEKPSTWKLDISDDTHIAGAITAMQSGGFRGEKVELTPEERASAKRKIAARINKIVSDKDKKANLLDRLNKLKGWDMAAEMEDEDTYEFDQTEVNYVALSTKKNQACANCRWFMADESDCYIVEDDPEPILATGYCDRWEARAVPEPEPTGAPQPVYVVNAPDEMGITEMERGIVDKVLSAIKGLLGLGQPDFAEFQVYKDKSGQWRWIAIHTNNFQDLDKEIISESAHEDYLWRVDKGLTPMPELRVWHIPGSRHGQADIMFGHGHFVGAVGHFDATPQGAKAIEYYQKHKGEHQLSQGFTYPIWALKDGVYQSYNTFEISTLPSGAAANPYTSFEEVIAMKMTDEKRRMLEEALGADKAGQLIADLEAKGKELETAVEYKDFAKPTQQTETPTPDSGNSTTNKVITQMIEDMGELAGSQLAIAKSFKERADSEVAKDSELAKMLKSIDDRLSKMEAAYRLTPRKASEAQATIADDREAAEADKQYPADLDPLWASAGLKVDKSKSNGAR